MLQSIFWAKCSNHWWNISEFKVCIDFVMVMNGAFTRLYKSLSNFQIVGVKTFFMGQQQNSQLKILLDVDIKIISTVWVNRFDSFNRPPQKETISPVSENLKDVRSFARSFDKPIKQDKDFELCAKHSLFCSNIWMFTYFTKSYSRNSKIVYLRRCRWNNLMATLSLTLELMNLNGNF